MVILKYILFKNLHRKFIKGDADITRMLSSVLFFFRQISYYLLKLMKNNEQRIVTQQ